MGMNTRLDLLATLPKGSVCAELGVFIGAFSIEILRRTRPKILYLVDRFTGKIRSGDENGENIKGANLDFVFHQLRARYELPFNGTDVVIVKAYSYHWLESLPENHLDWIYIDTDHAFRTTRLELEAAHKAVKPNGVIAGHDHDPIHYPGVVQAVHDFCERFHTVSEIFSGDALASYRVVNKKIDPPDFGAEFKT